MNPNLHPKIVDLLLQHGLDETVKFTPPPVDTSNWIAEDWVTWIVHNRKESLKP